MSPLSAQTRSGILATISAFVAAGLVWCALHVRNDVLQSQQRCEMSYMYAAYTRVDLSSVHEAISATAASTNPRLPAVERANGSSTSAAPEWLAGVVAATAQVAAAAGSLRHGRYQLWRYTGDNSGMPAQHSEALPVLFIPGNGGSHEMGRSLASETARRLSRLSGPAALSSADVHWYLLDLEGEWSAFDGGTLERQVQFTLAAMRHLATTYNITRPSPIPTSGSDDPRVSTANAAAATATAAAGGVAAAGAAAAGAPPRRPLPFQGCRQLHPGLVVVGHSMGGVVAAEALARAAEDPQLGPSLAALLLTLGSPLTRPALPGHPALTDFYTAAAARPRPVVPVVSLAGGVADVQVSTPLTNPAALAPEGFSRHVSLPSLPSAWCPARHNQLVSCNQAVVALGQGLVDLAQDALPALAAARKAASTPSSSSTATKAPAPRHHHPAGAHRDDDTYADDSNSNGYGGSGADTTVVATAPLLPWDWALRRMDRVLSHPAQAYLAAAVAEAEAGTAGAGGATGTAAEEVAVNATGRSRSAGPTVSEEAEPGRSGLRQGSGSEVEVGELHRRARAALAPAADGGAACGGANLAWYLQYGTPQQQQQPGRRRREAALRLMPYDLEGVPATGRMFAWQLARRVPQQTGSEGSRAAEGPQQLAAPRGWAAVVSGANPCSAFRVWLSVTIEQPAAADSSSGGGGTGGVGGGGSGTSGREQLEALEAEARRSLQAPARTVRHDVEVTGLAAPLPAVVAEGRWPVLARSDWVDVIRGRDYQSRAGWLLVLPPSLVPPLLQQQGAPPLDWDRVTADGGSGGGGGPTVTVTLTLWLGEPSHKPALRLVASPLPPQVGALRLRPLSPLVVPSQHQHPALPARQPNVHTNTTATTNPTTAAAPTAQSPPPHPLLLPLELPYLTTTATKTPAAAKWVDPVTATAVRWLGLYKYAAVRITNLDSQAAAVVAVAAKTASAAGLGASGGAALGGGCMYPALILTGGGSSRSLHLLQASVNHTLHSLEPCATDPRGCAAVTAVLDPGCSYSVEIVPYVSARLPSLLLSHAGELWLGVQLVALLAVAATTAAVASLSERQTKMANGDQNGASESASPLRADQRGGGVMENGDRPQAAAVEGAGPSAPPAPQDRPQRWRGRRRFRGWPALPWEGLEVLQVQGLPTLAVSLLTVTAIGAALLSYLPSLAPLGVASAPDSVAATSWGGALVPLWPLVRHAATAAGLCPHPHLDSCGWGPSSLQMAVAATATTRRRNSSGSNMHDDNGSFPGDSLCVLDWAVLAAVAVLVLPLLLAVALQVAATVAALVEVAVRLVVRLPCRLLLAPLRGLWRLRRGAGRGVRSEAAFAVARTSQSVHQLQDGAILVWSLIWPGTRWATWFAVLAGLAALAGAPLSATLPGLALLVSVLALGVPVCSLSPARLEEEEEEEEPQRERTSTPPVRAAAVTTAVADQKRTQPLCPPKRSWDLREMALLERRRRVAWLLYYAAYGMCAAPAVAGVLRRLVVRPAAVHGLAAAVLDAVRACVALLVSSYEGRGLGGAMLGLRLVLTAAADWASVAVRVAVGAVGGALVGDGGCGGSLLRQAGYVLAAVHCARVANSAVKVNSTAAVVVGTESSRKITRQLCHRGVWQRVRRVVLLVAGGVLGLAWWLGAPDAAQTVAAAVAAAHLL